MLLSDAQISQSLSDLLQQVGVSTLQSWWTNTVIPESHTWAYNYLVSVLASRGYTLAQITSSDQAPDYERNLSLWRALSKPAVGQNLPDGLLKTLDVREELKELCLTSGGAFLDPAGTAGQVGIGRESTTNDIFSWTDPDSDCDPPGPGIGKPTRW
jgi:hypothetical protein